MPQLPPECLYEIFEHLEDDRIALYSCLLVNRLWCGVSVQILWRQIWNYNTLVSSLPAEILRINGFSVRTLLFNYISFIKVLSVHDINYMLNQLQSTIVKEIYKSLMSQIVSLRVMDYSHFPYTSPHQSINFTLFPGADQCLKNLTEFHCHSDIDPYFFDNLKTISQDIKTLTVTFNDEETVSDELIDLISCQQGLKCVSIIDYYHHDNISDVLVSLPNTLNKLALEGDYIPLSFITFNFELLQELVISLYSEDSFVHFNVLEYAIFPRLKTFKISRACVSCDVLVKFIGNNGKSIREFYVGDNEDNSDNSLNLAIARSCPELRRFSTAFKDNELESLGLVFNSCQYLSSIRFLCGGPFLSEKRALEAFLKYSHTHKNAHELILYHNYENFEYRSELTPEELDDSLKPFFESRGNQKSFSFTIVRRGVSSNGHANDENVKIAIEKYIKSGGIKEFKIIGFDRCYEFDCIDYRN